LISGDIYWKDEDSGKYMGEGDLSETVRSKPKDLRRPQFWDSFGRVSKIGFISSQKSSKKNINRS
jgi:hypothetical protein